MGIFLGKDKDKENYKEKEMRLQKFLAMAGIASRRKCEEIILQGNVEINGTVVNELGIKVDVSKDKVKVNGKPVELEKNKIYIMLNKPIGYVSTVSDQFGRKTVIDLVKEDISKRLYPVGRLDYETEGLLIMTNDGDFALKLTHPKHNIDKIYIASLIGIPNADDIIKFKKGIDIDGIVTAPAKLEIVEINKNNSKVKITIHEGKNRQIRKMCLSIGHPVTSLKRVAIGNVVLGHLKKGRWRHLKVEEINELLGKNRRN